MKMSIKIFNNKRLTSFFILRRYMKKGMQIVLVSFVAVLLGANSALAEVGSAGGSDSGLIAIAAAIAMAFAALGGTLGQSKAVTAALDAIGRNPSAAGKIFTPMVIGLALIESLVIIAFVIANNLAGKL
jgi:F-type H+-transporting ATPase subunit c